MRERVLNGECESREERGMREEITDGQRMRAKGRMQKKIHRERSDRAERERDCSSSDVTGSLERFSPLIIYHFLNRRLVLIRKTIYQTLNSLLRTQIKCGTRKSFSQAADCLQGCNYVTGNLMLLRALLGKAIIALLKWMLYFSKTQAVLSSYTNRCFKLQGIKCQIRGIYQSLHCSVMVSCLFQHVRIHRTEVFVISFRSLLQSLTGAIKAERFASG